MIGINILLAEPSAAWLEDAETRRTVSMNAAPTPDSPRPARTIGMFCAAVEMTEPTKKMMNPTCLQGYNAC